MRPVEFAITDMQTTLGIIRRLICGVLVILSISSALFAQQNSLPAFRRIVIDYDSLLFIEGGSPLIDSGVVILNRYNNILFELERDSSSNTYSGSNKRFYTFFLEGHDKDWSIWSQYPVKEYTNLGSGNYALWVRYGSGGIITLEKEIFSFRVERPFYLKGVFLALYAVLTLLSFWFIYRIFIHRHISEQIRLERIIADRTEELTIEKEKTDSLLANLLPKGTADELMEKGKATKQKFNFVTVLFSDIQGFTRIAEEVNPEILIDELDKFFFQFDNVVEKYNIEKIKTIGDAYMCAGGIPKRNRTNPIEVVLAALEMQHYMEEMKEEQRKKGLIFWDIRIGIHTGTVIAGVVGHKKLSYDIWGDTVNTASRMESSGEPGKINISGITYEYVRDFFFCEYRGKMPVKYKGELDMYFVNGIRPELRGEGKNEPNFQFRNKMLLIKLTDLEEEVSEMCQENKKDWLRFHDSKYLKNIFTQSELIGRAERFDDEAMIVLLLASVFVMTGYVINYSDSQNEALNYMRTLAPEYGFTDLQVEEATKIISDALSSDPETIPGQVLNDSIYDHYGRVDLMLKLGLLLEEEQAINSKINVKDWYISQLDRIRRHNYFTPTAQLLRTNNMEQQAAVLENFISKL